MSGTVTASGVYNPDAETFSSLTITFSPMIVTAGVSSVTLYGTMSMTYGATSTLSIDCLVQAAGEVCWVKNWTFTLNASNQLTITGAYYVPAYGYVTITTPVPLTVSSITADPTAGVIDFTGANGTKAEMTFLSGSYSVSVHTANNTDYHLVNNQWQVTP